MTVANLEAILRSLGWIPMDGRSVTFRAWRHVTDERPEPAVILVPRTHTITKRLASRILRAAIRVDLR